MKPLDEILKDNPKLDLRIRWNDELNCFTAALWENETEHPACSLVASGNADTFGGALVRIHKLANK